MIIKKSVSLFFVCLLLITSFGLTVSAGIPIFTVQPEGGETTNWQTFTVTWEINGEYNFIMLQEKDELYPEWGNVETVRSPHTISSDKNVTRNYRLWVAGIHDDVYSDEFTITWKVADDVTNAEISPVNFGTLKEGYHEQTPKPVKIKNTGSKTLRHPELSVSEFGLPYFELIMNKEPEDIDPGTVDDTTWSLRPKIGLEKGDHLESLFLSAYNIEDYITSDISLSVVDPGTVLTYQLAVDNIDLGTFKTGNEPDFREIVVRSVGTGNLSNVSVYYDPEVMSFLRFQMNGTFADIPAGASSDGEWYVMPETGLFPGYYSADINVVATEADGPFVFTISFTVTGSESAPSQTEDNNLATVTGQSDVITSSSEPQTSVSVRILPSEKPGKTGASGNNNRTLNVILYVSLFAILTAFIVVFAYKIAKLRKEKEENDKK